MRTVWPKLVVIGALMGCTSDKDGATQLNTDTSEASVDPTDTGDEGDDTAIVDPGPTYTIWTGAPIVFEKANFADSTAPENQDAISDAVVLTRGNRGSLYNVVVETGANANSPEGTEIP